MNIFVGCASRNTNNPDYNNVAEKLGDYIVSHKHNLVFGGCEYGLMGKLYEKVKQTESKIFITIAEAYKSDLDNLIYTEAFLTQTVNERKDSFIRISDVLVFLPGGIGTIDELMTAIETRRNHEHDVPIIIVNINEFFDHQLSMLEKIYAEEFADEKNRNMYVVCSSFEELTAELENVHSDNELSFLEIAIQIAKEQEESSSEDSEHREPYNDDALFAGIAEYGRTLDAISELEAEEMIAGI